MTIAKHKPILMLILGVILQLGCHTIIAQPEDIQAVREPERLISTPLARSDWDEISRPLQDYVANYDLKIVCAETELPMEICEPNSGPLAVKYFLAAIEQTERGPASRIWRLPGSGLLYGAMLILDPEETDIAPVTQLLAKAKAERDACTNQVIGIDAPEKLRYLRIHVGATTDVKAGLRKLFHTQFVEETMKLYLCSEFYAAGKHNVAIFPNYLAQEHFTKFGFRRVLCTEALYEACPNPWFSNRCLMVKQIVGELCNAK